MKSPSSNRQQLFVAPRVQGRLLIHASLYCLASSATTAFTCLLLLPTTNLASQASVLLTAVLVATVAIVPFCLYHVAKTSNRIVGPFIRVQGIMRRVAQNANVTPVVTREGDDWDDWMHDLNSMIERVEAFDADEVSTPVEQNSARETCRAGDVS